MAKKAVLIGINYPGTDSELHGCVNDVITMYQCLIQRFGFDDHDITVLIDTDPDFPQPTGKNIVDALINLVESAEPGDVLYVHYSGHGTRLPAATDDDDDTGFDECIVPSDLNLVTDDDFKELVCRVPDGCRITIVSDSCNSGGLISGAKEQIGESTQSHSNQDHSGSSGFVKQEVRNIVTDAIKSCGIHLPHHRSRNYEADYKVVKEDSYKGRSGSVKSRSLPLSTLIDMLKKKTGRDDIDAGKIRHTLFDMFGEDSSPKIKKFGELLAAVGELAKEFFKKTLSGKGDDYAKPARDAEIESKEEMHADTTERTLPRNGILLSGCQTDQTSADNCPSGNESEAYGAFSNSIQTILRESDGDIRNDDLVSKVRQLLESEGYTQLPGLYCTDDYVDAPFIC